MRAWPRSISSSPRNSGSGWTRRTEVAGRRLARADRLGVVADLHVDGVEVGRHRLELRADALAMGSKEREPLLLVAVAGADQLGVAAHLADRHPGRPQFGDQLNPPEVAFRVAAMPRAGP